MFWLIILLSLLGSSFLFTDIVRREKTSKRRLMRYNVLAVVAIILYILDQIVFKINTYFGNDDLLTIYICCSALCVIIAIIAKIKYIKDSKK